MTRDRGAASLVVWGLVVALSGLGVSRSALHASTLVPAGVEQLAREASLIVLGTVARVTPSAAAGSGRVERRVTIAVERVTKGAARHDLVVVVPGGTLGRYRTVMVGAPAFVEGEQVVLFLARRPEGEWRVLGLSQGVFRVADLDVGRVIVPPPTVRLPAETVPSSDRLTRGTQAGRVMTVDAFLERVASMFVARPGFGGRLP